MSRAIALLCLVVALPLSAAESGYRIVHPDGTIEFTDQPPQQGGESVQLDSVPTYEAPPARAASPARTAPTEPQRFRPDGPPDYQVQISRPQPQETFWVAQWQVPASVQVEPALEAGHQLVLMLDGQVVARGGSGSYTLEPVYRGAHQLGAAVVDADGRRIAESPSVTFFVHKPTRQRQ